MTHRGIVAALFDAGASVSTRTINPGKDLQQDHSVVGHFLDHGLDPNAVDSTTASLCYHWLTPGFK
ncbi:hypothetical protein BBP40_002898 [Aspergillus hancockii]|nr:hypothetical protein BBP40_002898 [Aspergillus hancockii]